MMSVPGHAQDFAKTDILVLGDSQLMFNGGPRYAAFFENLGETCSAALPGLKEKFTPLIDLDTGILAVRSVSIDDFLYRDQKDKSRLCVPEESWPVNARGYGTLSHPGEDWVQIGQHHAFPFCEGGRSALEIMFGMPGTRPEVAIFLFLARTAEKWQDPAAARADAQELSRQIPEETGCVFMTTAPTFNAETNAFRKRAAENFAQALRGTGNKCTPVAGFTDTTMTLMSGTPHYFVRDEKTGAVKDPFHPNEAGIDHYLKLVTEPLCRAIENNF